jgi:hypothetical protein
MNSQPRCALMGRGICVMPDAGCRMPDAGCRMKRTDSPARSPYLAGLLLLEWRKAGRWVDGEVRAALRPLCPLCPLRPLHRSTPACGSVQSRPTLRVGSHLPAREETKGSSAEWQCGMQDAGCPSLDSVTFDVRLRLTSYVSRLTSALFTDYGPLITSPLEGGRPRPP